MQEHFPRACSVDKQVDWFCIFILSGVLFQKSDYLSFVAAHVTSGGKAKNFPFDGHGFKPQCRQFFGGRGVRKKMFLLLFHVEK